MALVTVGNTRIGNTWNVRYQNYFTTCEYNASYSFIYYKLIATERSYEKKIRIAFYVRYPSSRQYENTFGYYPKYLIPAVFRAENGRVAEVLSEGHLTFPINDLVDCWQIYEVYLKRDFMPGEEIWAGVWGETLTPVWDSSAVAKGTVGENFLYVLGLHGRQYDYAPYFDNGEVIGTDQGNLETLGMTGMLGNYSLYWQYFNAPVPNVCNARIGNPRMGNKWIETFDYDSEDDEGEEIVLHVDMEPRIDDYFIGYFFRLDKPTVQTNAVIHLFQRYPRTDNYINWADNLEARVYPAVYRCDSVGNFIELMNTSVYELEPDISFTGWIDAEITLKRNLNAGEYFFAGFLAFSANPVWHGSGYNGEVTGTAIAREYYYGLHSPIEKMESGEMLTYNCVEKAAKNYSMYFEYCVQPSVAYVRSVSSSGNVVAVSFRSAGFKTLLEEIKNIRDSSERNIALHRLFSDVERMNDGTKRISDYKRTSNDALSLRDFLLRSAGLVARVFSLFGGSDEAERFLGIRRSVSSESKASSRVNAGRLIFRTVATVFGLWDWLKGKIRNENCIVELFTPITDELILECKI